MVAEVVVIAGGVSISIFRSTEDNQWYWYFTDQTETEPVGPYLSRWDAWTDANDTEAEYGRKA